MRTAGNSRILLASASPRRAALLTQIGLPFDIAPADLDESTLPGESPADYVLRLANAKAQAAAQRDRVTVAADTIVVHQGSILGKPCDAKDNRHMLERLNNSCHEVFTGMAVHYQGSRESLGVVATVWFRDINPREIDSYVAQGEGLDKAGGYGIQGVGSVFVSHISGSYSAVVGLPLAELETMLVKFGIDTWRLRNNG